MESPAGALASPTAVQQGCGFGVKVSPLLITISCGVCHLLPLLHPEGSADAEVWIANYRRASQGERTVCLCSSETVFIKY